MSEYAVYWVAGLSDGNIATEGKGDFEEVADQPSPWQKLLKHLEENDLEIRSFKIRVDHQGGFDELHLPSKGGGSTKEERPNGYRYHTAVAQDFMHGQPKGGIHKKLHIIAEYNDFDLHLWVDKNNPRQMGNIIRYR